VTTETLYREYTVSSSNGFPRALSLMNNDAAEVLRDISRSSAESLGEMPSMSFWARIKIRFSPFLAAKSKQLGLDWQICETANPDSLSKASTARAPPLDAIEMSLREFTTKRDINTACTSTCEICKAVKLQNRSKCLASSSEEHDDLIGPKGFFDSCKICALDQPPGQSFLISFEYSRYVTKLRS